MIFDFFKKKKKITRIMIVGILIISTAVVTMCCTTSTKIKRYKYWKHYTLENSFLNFITNARVIDNQLFCATRQGILRFDDFDTRPEYHTITNMLAGYEYRPIMSDVLIAYIPPYTDSAIYFDVNYLRKDPVSKNGIRPIEFGSQFENYFFHLHKPLGVDFGIFHENKFISFIVKHVGIGMDRYDPYIVYADVTLSSNMRIEINNKGFWSNPNWTEKWINLNDMIVYNNKIYISYNDGGANILLEISEDNTIKETYCPFPGLDIITFFHHRGYLCGYLTNKIVVYTTDGETWFEGPWISPLMYDWYEIDDYLFIPLQSKLYILEGEIPNWSLFQINTDDLRGLTISSVQKFKDDLVITTSNGVFYKPLSQVLKDKKIPPHINRGQFELQGE